MAKKKNKTSSQKKNTKSTNGWDFLIKVADLTYNLINSGNIIGAGFLGFVIWVLLITFKMPPDALGPLVSFCIDVLSNMKVGYSILGSGLAVSLFANLNMYKTYKTEIKRLTDQRKILIHGLQTGLLSEIETHKSCNTDI